MTVLDSPSSARANNGGDPVQTTPPRKRSRIHRLAMRPRRILVRVHRWLSIGLLAWLIVVGVTGAYLVESHWIESKVHAQRYDAGDGDLGPQAAIDSVTAVMPAGATVTDVLMPSNGRGVYQVGLEIPEGDAAATDTETGADAEAIDPEATDPEAEAAAAEEPEPEVSYLTYYVNPATAEVNGTSDPESGFRWWMYRGHMYLWQDNGLFGADNPNGGMCVPDPDGIKGVFCAVLPSGGQFVGYLAVGWMVVLLTGIYLWFWPGIRRWATAIRVRTHRGGFTTNLDLHRMVGFLFWVPLVVVTFTGMAFAFPNLKGWYENATPAQRDFELWTPPEDLVSSDADGRTALDATGALAAVHEATPDRTVEWLMPPFDETGTWQAWVDRGYSTWTREAGGGNTLMALDQYDGEVLYDGTPEDGNVADQLWSDWSFPLHAGDFGGAPTRVLWVLVGLSPIILAVTGVTMNLIRRSKRKRRRPTVTTDGPGRGDAVDLREPVDA